MAYAAIMSLKGAATATAALSSAHYIRRRIPSPASTILLLPAALSAHFCVQHSQLHRPRVSAFAAAGGSLLQDAGATALVFGGAYALVATFNNLTRCNIIEQDEGLIKSVSREGKPEELLKGPLYYVLVLILCAVLFWRESPVGMTSLAMMCAGDGIADIMGRRFGSIKIPYNPHKSWAGSISMFLFSFVVAISMLYYFWILGYIQLDWMHTIERVALVSLVATFVESLPTNGIVDDNISVPLASMVTSLLVFGY